MERSYYWNIYQEYHPKNCLVKYLKPAKISQIKLQKLIQLQKLYHKLPPIIYTYQDNIEENQDIILEYDIFGQQCNLSMKNLKSIWKSTSFYISDHIYQQLKRDLFSTKLDNESIFLCLFPIYIDINHKTKLTMNNQDEEVFLPSTIPTTKHDLYQLQQRFDLMLYNEHALEIGLCPKRRRIYNDLFDELIRIIFLQCSERGLLLSRIKNEYIQWMNTYEELYSSGMAYGLREYLHKIEEKQKLESIIQQVENDCQQLHNEINQELVRNEKLTRLNINDDDDDDNERNLLKNNVNILRSTNEILRREVHNALNNILSSTIFLGEPIDYNKDLD